jgi:hypothetical protein
MSHFPQGVYNLVGKSGSTHIVRLFHNHEIGTKCCGICTRKRLSGYGNPEKLFGEGI